MFEPIAIVGRSCILPGAHSPDALWEAVSSGRDLLSRAPDGRWDLPPALSLTPDPSRSADRSWSDRGGYVTGFDFASELARDPFPRAAEDLLPLDPLFHWVLSAGRQALREAGYEGDGSRNVEAIFGNLGFPSSSMSRYAEGIWMKGASGLSPIDPRNRFMSGLPALLLAEQLRLRRAFTLDAACASSLYAIKLCCDKLQRREIDLGLAGAVCRSDDLFIHVGFCALDAMSKSGRSRPFHREADGLVPAEGAAFVSLMRLQDAVASGRRIYGVIRGVGLSNDGRGRGLLAPSSEGQVRALKIAWAQAERGGVDPSRLSLVECHATGTPVGDGAEIETLMAALGDRVIDTPIGSLKSNLGHLITAAGAAGLVKVLSALEHDIRPPTLHVDAPLPLFETPGPFRLLTRPEPWPREPGQPRLAAISAFGFGGNNAHLVVEEHIPGLEPRAISAASHRREIAIVAASVRAGGGDSLDFAQTWREGAAQRRAEQVTLPLEKLRFPPNDLAQTSGQQLMLLDAAMEAASAVPDLPRERTAVLIGAQTDAEVCRYGARWRLPVRYPSADPDWLTRSREALVPVLRSAGVVGTMPNIPANRISSQLDLGGPGFTFAMEEASGIAALQSAAAMLEADEIDAALVGAVDLSCEPVHEAALRAILPGQPPAGDAAVVLVLVRAEDAESRGLKPLARLLAERPSGAALPLGEGGVDLSGRFGRAHAAHGLLHVAAAAHAVARGEAAAEVAVTPMQGALGSRTERVFLAAPAGAPLPLPARPQPPQRPLSLPLHPPEVVLIPADVEPMPLAPALPRGDVRPLSAPQAPAEIEAMPAPPALDGPAIRPRPEQPQAPSRAPAPSLPLEAPVPRAEPQALVAARPQEIARSAPLQPARPPSGAPEAMLLGMADLHRRLGEAHRSYLERQHATHQQFLGLRQRTEAMLFEAARARRQGRPLPAPQTAPLTLAAQPPAPVLAPPAAPPAAPPKVAVEPEAAPQPAPQPAPKAAPQAAPSAAPKGQRQGPLPGPKWSREQLLVLSSDKISKVFGERFAIQDDFPRQVRMPEPPLLLADRVVGLDAEPGSMKTGVIWTETDVRFDSWYLHDGVMPAGVMIEAGQADLLLISWLGADLQNRGERVYRLLGCQLTYRNGLPRPGDTLRYEIHVDGHANLGATRIFFFHYDCVDQSGAPRLEVREGQAGFFSDAELAESGGILWSPETGEHDESAPLDPPVMRSVPHTYNTEQILAFAKGDGYSCFGKGYERLQTQVRPPRIAPPPMSFWTRVTDLDPSGGPWKRGYMRAEQDIRPEDWFFQGHFKDDPCMPGTMMFEACLQASAFLMTAYGFTLRRDGWTFEPVPDVPYDLKCRGQVIPSSKHLVYEVFVEEVRSGPWPVLWADFLCTIDGLKAFHARRVGVRLRPDWPITSMADMQDLRDSVPVARTPDGFEFGYKSLIACAWGKPSDAFGKMYAPFDGGKHCARLPGPPYHFMSRVTRVHGEIGAMQIGTEIDLEYDIPPDAWYFEENASPTMPFCVLLEAALQPCGWIASYVGSALTTDQELFFRNLDGTATWTEECLPGSGTLKTQAKITAINRAGGMIIESFDVTCSIEGRVIYTMKTVFGFFPRESLANQIGITPTAEDRARRDEPCDYLVDLTTRPERYCSGPLRMPRPMLLMLDRITGYWPSGGAHKLGRLRSEKDVDPSEWFFKAHFYADPVQPGSLGIEAMIQLIQFYLIETEAHAGMSAPRFEPLMLGAPLTWKYRGQVVPENKVIRCEIDIVQRGTDDRGVFAIADAWLWVDELRIYQAVRMGVRVVDGGLPSRAPSKGTAPPALADVCSGESLYEEILDPASQPWLKDHPPTWTTPALPAMSIVDRVAASAHARSPQAEVVEVRDLTVGRFVVLPTPVSARTICAPLQRQPDGSLTGAVRFEVWRDSNDPKLSRFDPVSSGIVHLASRFPAAPEPWEALTEGEIVPDPYNSGHLFHGPALRYLVSLRVGRGASSAVLDAAAGSAPPGELHQGLLDAVTHAIPHDELWRFSEEISPDLAAYPYTIRSLRLYSRAPAGKIRVEARFIGLVSERMPELRLQAVDLQTGRVWLELHLVEILVPKGPIGSAPAASRLAFLKERRYVPGLMLSSVEGSDTVAHEAPIRASDWLPGTVRSVYGLSEGADLLEGVAVGDHVARIASVHPGSVRQEDSAAVSSEEPLTRWPIEVVRGGGEVRVRSVDDPILDLTPVRRFWERWFAVPPWPVEDLYYGLIHRFVRRVRLVDPAAHAAIHGKSVLYLANHQVGVESLLFSIVASGLSGVSTVTLAKAEHRESWLGRLIHHCFRYPGVRDPNVISFFDRDDKASLPQIISDLAAEMRGPGKSVMVHIEGTRSLSCRTPVQKMSSAFLDMALAVRAPIIPVRFVGGLPAEPLAERIEFPVAMAAQDLWLGPPISPEQIEALPYKDRKDLVISAINTLGVPNSEEQPNEGDPVFLQKVLQRCTRTGVDSTHATLLEVLAEQQSPHPDITRIVEGDRRGVLEVGDSPSEVWATELARRLYGPFGAQIRR